MKSVLTPTDSKSSLLAWLLFVSGALVFAFLSGRLTPHEVADSPSYLEYSFASLDQICRSIRTPGYPLWLLLFKKTIGIQAVPAAQVIVHATAAWWLFCELAQWGMPTRGRLATAVAVGIGCTAMDNIHVISSDALAASLGVMTATSLLRWARLDGASSGWFAIVVASTLAIFLRPAYLFLIPWMLVAGTMLRRLRGTAWGPACWASLRVSLGTLLLVVGWMSMRLAVVGDFAILPFGHQNLAGILVQLVSDEELKEVGGDLGAAIVDAKHRFDADVGLAEGEGGATMTIDARWDDMTWAIVFPASKTVADDLVASHRATAALNKSIVRRYPFRYASWLVKAARRAPGRSPRTS